jgi:hypothetical protein
MPQSGAQSKKIRTGRGFRQLPFAYSQLEVNVLAEQNASHKQSAIWPINVFLIPILIGIRIGQCVARSTRT